MPNNQQSVVQSDPELLSGTPVFTGTRVPIFRHSLRPSLFARPQSCPDEHAAPADGVSRLDVVPAIADV
jgi:hypothetical protein